MTHTNPSATRARLLAQIDHACDQLARGADDLRTHIGAFDLSMAARTRHVERLYASVEQLDAATSTLIQDRDHEARQLAVDLATRLAEAVEQAASCGLAPPVHNELRQAVVRDDAWLLGVAAGACFDHSSWTAIGGAIRELGFLVALVPTSHRQAGSHGTSREVVEAAIHRLEADYQAGPSAEALPSRPLRTITADDINDRPRSRTHGNH